MTINRLEDYTDAELVNLTEEQVIDLIDLECGYEGVRLLPTLPEHPKKEDLNKDFEVWEVPAMTFANNADAIAVVAASAGKSHVIEHYVPGPGYQKYGQIDTDHSIGISSKKIFSHNHYKEIETRLKQYESNKQDYDKAKKEYDDIAKARSSIIDSINNAISEARSTAQRLSRLEQASLRYLTLAHGDKEIAMRFMLDAYKENADAIEEHFDQWTIKHVTDKISA